MTERESEEHFQPPALETGVTNLEPGPVVQFRLLPNQRFELSVAPDGSISLHITAAEGGATPPPAPAPELAQAADQETRSRVSIAGRVGTATAFRTTPKGTKIARFTVAEHPDTDSTTWRTVLAFGQRAQDLQATPLVKGQAVEVIGYPHHRQVKTNGVHKTVEEIYATAIKRR